MTETTAYSLTIADRLHRRLVPGDGECIVWTGARSHWGYGRIGRGSRAAGWAATHRVSWELANGPIPDGLFVLHRCDNPPCCNPDHLFLGTLAENTQDMLGKGRARGHFGSGSAHPTARLTEQQVAELRDLASIVNNYAELGRRFGITKQHARSLVLNLKRAA